MAETPREFTIGVDLGQRVDHSAVCLVEKTEQKAIVRLILKYPLGTDYPLVVNTIADLTKDIQKQGEILSFTVDATGVGTIPAEMFQEALPEINVDNFIFTNKSKRELIGKVKVLHSFGRLKFATRKGDDAYNRTLLELMQEMKQLQAKVIRLEGESPEVEVFRTGEHDDLFTALALAVKDLDFPKDVDTTTALFVEDKTMLETMSEPTVILF